MHKQASFAVSALISISTVTSPAVAADFATSTASGGDSVTVGSHGSIHYSRAPRFNSEARRSLAQVLPVPANTAPRTVSPPPARAFGLRPGYIRLQPTEPAHRTIVNHLQRGLSLRQQGNLDGALVEFLKAAQENPSQVRAFYEQALIFKQKGHSKLAQSALQQALTVKPDFHDARVLLASLYLQDGDLSHATKELFTSLGLDLDKGFGSQKMPPPTPLRQPSIVQTPHGRLPVPSGKSMATAGETPPNSGSAGSVVGGASPVGEAAPSVVPQAVKDIVGIRAAASPPSGTDAFNEAHGQQGSMSGESRQATANNAGSPVNQDPTGSFSVKEISSEQSSDEQFLKKILGFNPPVSSIAVPGAAPTPPALPEQAGTSVVGLDDHPVPKGAGEAKVLHASNNQAEQLLRQLKGAPQKTDSFSWFNPFSWFDKPKAAPPAEKKPAKPDVAAVSKVQKQAEHELAAQKKSEEKKAEQQLAADKKAEEKARKKITHTDFNPVQTLEVTPTEEVHKPDHPSLLKKAFGWIPGFKDAEPHEPAQYSLPPAPSITSADGAAPAAVPPPSTPALQAPAPGQPAAPTAASESGSMIAAGLRPPAGGTAAIPAPPTPSTNTDALQSVLKMLPKDIAQNIEQVLMPGKDQPAPVSGDSPAVAGINKNVFENLVTARVSSSSMPEAAPPPVSTPNTVAPPHAVLTPYIGSIPNTVPTPYTVAVQNVATPAQSPPVDNTTNTAARVVETTLEAQVARAGIYIPPQLRTVPPRAGRLAAQGFRFISPELVSPQQYVIKGAHPRPHPAAHQQTTQQEDPSADSWTKRMRYLLANGTGSLAPGEAFMFSEETGEGVFFMPDGSSIRRKVAKSLGHEAVVQLRRPDIYNDKGELQYNLAVMGKVILPMKNESVERMPGHFDNNASVKELLNREQGFLGWLKGVFTL
ncbi:MAG TPA: tetratricopeptide repeat protein [Candidatus Obscuribacterales bacterium]